MLFSETSGSAAALCALYSGVIAFILILIISTLLSKAANKNIIDAAHSAFGAFGKYAVSIIILLYLAVSSLITLSEFSNLTKLISFPTAPVSFVAIFIAISAAFAAFGGLRTVLRLHGIFVPLILAATVLLIASTVYTGDILNLFPILGTSTERLFGKGLSGIIMYTDIILFFLITPKAPDSQQANKKVLFNTGIGVLINFLFILAFNLSIPYSTSAEGHFPVYLLLKEVYYGRFFQRIDAIILLVSNISGMLYLALNIFLFCNILKQTFNINKRPAVLIYTAAIFFAVVGSRLIPSNLLTYLVFICGFSAFAIMLLASFFAKRRSATNEDK